MLGLLIFLTIRGYNYGTNVHHDQILPFILRLMHPGMFRADAYVDSADRYPSLFPQIMAAMAGPHIALPALFGTLYAITIVLLIVGILRLGETLVETPKTALLAAVLILSSQFLNSQSFFGEDAIFRSYLEPTMLAWAALMWALSFWIRGRRKLSFLLLGLAANINPLPVLHIGLACAFGDFFTVSGELLWDRARRWGEDGWIAIIGSSPLWIHLVRMPPSPAVDTGLWIQSLKTWYPFHYFPETWPLGKWLLAGAYVLLYAVLLLKADRRTRQRFQPLMAGASFLLVMGFAARLSGCSLPIRLQFFRADALLVLFGSGLTAQAAMRRFQAGTLRGLLCGGLLVSTVTIWFCWPLALVSALTLLSEPLIPDEGRGGILWQALWVLVIGSSLWSIDRCSDGQTALVSPYIALALIGISLGMALSPRVLSGFAKRAVCVGALLLANLPLFGLLADRIKGGTLSNLDREMRSFEREWVSLELWCRDHTPAQSRFIVSPEMWSFRNFSERSVFFQWVDGAAMHWDPGYVAIWRERIADLHGDAGSMGRQWERLADQRYPALFTPQPEKLPPSPLEIAYDALTAEDFRRLEEKYRLDYLVAKAAEPSLPFPILWQGTYYRLYALHPLPS